MTEPQTPAPEPIDITELVGVYCLGRDELSFRGEVDELERGLHDARVAHGLALPVS